MLRKWRIITLALCALLCLALAACAQEKPAEPVFAQEVFEQEGMRKTVLYYASDGGLIVPVVKLIPWEEGIAKAALSQLVETNQGETTAELGLKAVLPDGASYSIRIDDETATARLALSNLPEFETALEERNMVTALVNTLSEFTRIDNVLITVDGKSELPHGTDISQPLARQAMNVEGDGEYPVTLYFPDRSHALNIPVTRLVGEVPSLELALNELIKGPYDISLKSCFPDGTALEKVSIEDGVACIYLSSEFDSIMETPALEQSAFDSMQLTCVAFDDITAISVFTGGKPYEGLADTAIALPVYANVLN